MAGKQYKKKDCAYCGGVGISKTADHVIARSFFFESDRDNLPQVPACTKCNNIKSELEHYASAALMAGSNHVEADRYRQEMVRPRMDKNLKLQREIGLVGNVPRWMNVNGVIQPMHALKIDARKLQNLMRYVVRGLYCFHIGKPLGDQFYPDVAMQHPNDEPRIWASVADWFPDSCPRFGSNLGRGSFTYEGAQSPASEGFSVWRMSWHGVRLHGENTPPQGVGVWWAFTRPAEEAVKAAEANGAA